MNPLDSNQKSDIIKDILLKTGLATGLSENELIEIAKIGVERPFKKGSIVISEDSTTRDLYLLSEGQVSIRLTLPATHFTEETIKKMSAPEIFGEFSLANGSPRSATVKAEVDLITFQFEYDRLVELMEDNTRIGYNLMRNMAGIIAGRVRENHELNRTIIGL